MIRAILLILNPEKAWVSVVQARRDWRYVLVAYLLPMMLLVAAAEATELMGLGKWQAEANRFRSFSGSEALVYEALQSLLILGAVFICAHIIKVFGQTFHGRNTFAQAFTVTAYGLGPVFLFRLLDAFPHVNPWVGWVLGIFCSLRILYIGLPAVMLPDPPHALGLYLMSSALLVAITGLFRFVTAQYLAGQVPVAEPFISHLASWLPFHQ